MNMNLSSRVITAIMICLLGISGTANASWIQYIDLNGSDTATNPGFGAGGPGNQGPATVGTWLQDLIDTSSAPTLLGQADNFSAGTISGLAASGSLFLTLHYGNYLIANVKQNDVTVAYSCAAGCSSFTGYSTDALSNYRYFGTSGDTPPPPTDVPEPMTLGLMGIGLAGIGLRRRKA
jgi:hypothetical protein